MEFVSEKKAYKPVLLDVKGLSSFCDYFVVCSGETSRQVEAISDSILKGCKNSGIAIHHFEKDELSQWILIDLFDVVVHTFYSEAREFYNLEYLWRDAKKIRIMRSKSKSIDIP